MNSGMLSAYIGNLEQAEREYSAAINMNSKIPDLYFNFAVLKARQNKGEESLDNLTLAGINGFDDFSYVKNDPAFQILKSNPLFKSRIEAFERKSRE